MDKEDGHQDWVRFSPNNANPIIVSAGWDKYVKVLNLTTLMLWDMSTGKTTFEVSILTIEEVLLWGQVHCWRHIFGKEDFDRVIVIK